MKLKSRLLSGEKLSGCWLGMYNPVAAEVIAQAGYDVGMVDLEHGPGSYLDALNIMPVLELHGCIPAIRIPFAHEAEVKKAMDLGPLAIMVPNLRSVEEAEYMVRSTRYGPKGIRGAAPRIIRATQYGKTSADYQAFLEKEFLLIGQVETRQALEQVEDIAAVEGLDMLFVGPSDLSASLGQQGNFTSDEFMAAIERIEKAAKDAGKLLGSIPLLTRSAAELFQSGYQLVISGTDTILLKTAAENDIEKMKEAKRAFQSPGLNSLNNNNS